MNTKPPTAQQIGAALERAAHAIAPLIAAAYVAGYMLGAAVHRLNDRLAGITPQPAPAAPSGTHWSSPGDWRTAWPPTALQAGHSSASPTCSASAAPQSAAASLPWRDLSMNVAAQLALCRIML